VKRVVRSEGKGLIPAGEVLHVKIIERPKFKMRFYPRTNEKLGRYGYVTIGPHGGKQVSLFNATVAWWHE
jgi:hypothetical protein